MLNAKIDFPSCGEPLDQPHWDVHKVPIFDRGPNDGDHFFEAHCLRINSWFNTRQVFRCPLWWCWLLGKSNSECRHDRGYWQMPQHDWRWFPKSFMCCRFICKPCIVRCCLSGSIALLTSTFEPVLYQYRLCIFPIASNHHLISNTIFIFVSLKNDNFKFYFTFHGVHHDALERSVIIVTVHTTNMWSQSSLLATCSFDTHSYDY